MTLATIARILVLAGLAAALVEQLLAQLWTSAYWRGPALRFRRRSAAAPSAAAIVAAASRSPDDAVFVGLAARELRPGWVALRERTWQRGPHLGYYPALRAHLFLDPTGVTLAVAPTLSASLLAAGSLVALAAPWYPLLIATPVLLVVGFGAVVQATRLRRLLATIGAVAASRDPA